MHIAAWNGSAWSPLGSGVDGTVYSLLDQGTSLLVGGGFGRAGDKPSGSIARWDDYLAAVEDGPPSSRLRLNVYPNPAMASMRLSVTADPTRRVSITVHDISGRVVANPASDLPPGGALSFLWDGRGRDGRPLPAGAYFVKVDDGRQSVSTRLTIVR
jgi:hypothetical protein